MNRTELRDALAAAGVPDDLYSLQGVHPLDPAQETCYLLGGSGGDVRVGVFERGGAVFGFAGTEDDACDFLFGELVFPEQAPVVIDEDEAGRRSRDLIALVDTGLDEGARLGPVAALEFHLRPGDVVDRFGPESGTYLFPAGTAAEQRSQPPTAIESGYHRYLVAGDIPTQAGVAGPAFDQPGGAVMMKLDPARLSSPPPLMTVRWLLREGLLRQVAG